MKSLVIKFNLFVFSFLYFSNLSAQEAPSWVDFCTNRESGKMRNSVLLDYSYAGYHFSEKPIPDLSTWNTISVIDYGATPNDDTYDEVGIQSAIDAAEASGVPTVVYFPSGRYKVGSEKNKGKPIEVNKSFIVLKGAGSGTDGTEIFADKHGDVALRWNTPWQFLFEPWKRSSTKIASITSSIQRGDKTVEVDNSTAIVAGQLVELAHQGVENLELNLPGLEYSSKWPSINKNGIMVMEKHLVTKVKGNTIYFKNPVNYNVPLNGDYASIKTFEPIEEVGVQDILFTSAWKDYPEDFVHHANNIVDYAWRAVRYKNVYNSWIKNVKFRDWNDCIQISESFSVTVKDIQVSGKQGHASYMAAASTGVLFGNCKDNVPVGFNDAGGQAHGPAFQRSSTGCVYTNVKMQKHQSVDCHSETPYGNLFDNIQGGCFRGNGGSEKVYPNSGPDLVFWNFVHSSNYAIHEFDFWSINKRRLHTYAKPKFVGFTSPGEDISFKNVGLDELHGTQVYPQSLFDAQLQLRLYDVYASASSQKKGCPALNVLNNKVNDFWSPKNSLEDSYLMLDFGTNRSVNSIFLKENQKSIKKFKLECWIDGGWVSYMPKQSANTDNAWELDSMVVTRKVKLVIEETYPNRPIQIIEFKAL
ncbi:Pectate lyase superfamily protein [Hyunsoonleella jejuensis]|uniref:Pectate lyase superfamily protein n=1 Tax=Hyunsoonleella jejuensis TaxID=419940 RepID=A0A1H9IRW1_9FLAO|nr:DUF4955 domain-containing protein [Hyunsoonleella jejuensis]SEQ77343.1 Pectate lyase superfamily protein [Hyunsoonleella jejuensis]